MNGIEVILLCAILGILAYLRYRRLFNPLFIFCIIFSFSAFLSILEIDGVPVPQNETYAMVGLGVFAFWTGGMLSDNKYKFKRKNCVYNINFKKLKIITIVGIISSMIELKNTIVVFINYGLAGVYTQRLAVQFDGANNLMRKSYFESVCNQFIFLPCIYFLMLCYLYLYFRDSERKYLIYSIICLFGTVLSNGGRTSVLVFVIYYVVLMTSLKNNQTSDFLKIDKTKIKYIMGALLIGFLLIYVFIQRSTDIVKTIGSYYGYPIIHMEEKLSKAVKYQYTYGMASFQGIFRPVLNVIEKITGHTFILLENASHISDIANSAIRLAPSVMYNAFVTPFYYFYIDFGWYGIIVLSFLFGWFSNKLYTLYIKCGDDQKTLLFLLNLGLPICFSIVRFQYALGTIPWAMFITLFICTNKCKKICD